MNSKEIRTERYQKDVAQEQTLRQLNDLLKNVSLPQAEGKIPPRHPLVFLVGAPRSGSTLIAQYLAASGCFGYISNFTARFWENPVLGRTIEKRVIDLFAGQASDFSSIFGVTNGLKGSHEFGYFWERWFLFNTRETHQLSDQELRQIDHLKFREEVFGLADTFNLPLFFKNLTCSFQTSFLANLFPRSIFVVCERDPRYQSQSILAARRELLGDIRHWWSLRPPQFRTLYHADPYEQVAGQIHYTMAAVQGALTSVGPDRALRVRYERFCAAPKTLIKELCRRCCISKTENPLPAGLPTSFAAEDTIRTDSKTWEMIERACRKFFTDF